MEAQILDADCAQALAPDPTWARRLRANESAYFRQHDAKELSRRQSARGASFIVRLWCRVKDGRSLCVVVADPWSTSYTKLKTVSPSALECLAQKLQAELNGLGGAAEAGLVYRRTTNGFRADPETLQPQSFPWLRVRVANAYLRNQLAPTLARLQRSMGVDLCLPEKAEARVEVHSELLESLGLRPGAWLRLASSVRIESGLERVFASLHAQVLRADITRGGLATDQDMAPVRVLSWDIECYSATHAFPLAENQDDCIIAIGVCTRTLYGQQGDEDLLVITLKDVGAEAVREEPPALRFRECESEASVLRAFADAVVQSDADILVGYNTCGFDWRYIKVRVERLVEKGEISKEDSALFYRFGRLLAASCPPQEQQLTSSAMGENPLCYPRTPGRVGVDLWLYLKLENVPELPNLKLNTVAQYYLKDAKIELPAKQIFAEFERAPSGRRLVAVYCCKDCLLVLELVHKLSIVPRLLEMAKVTGAIPEDLLYRGQQIKVYTQLLAAAHERDEYVVEDVGATHDEDDKYKGAHVEEPLQGYYADPILTVDFASLYPSLMRTYNLSPDTLLPGPSNVPHCTVALGDGREPLRFVAPSHCRGLLPKILDSLLHERQRAKACMSAESCAFKRDLLNAKQLALKKSANSVYGACGSARGVLQCRAVAEATTSTGRGVIAFTKKTIEQDFRLQGCRVVYGDSVTGDTPLVVRDPRAPERWWTCRIDSLVEEAQWAQSTRRDKDEVRTDLEVWTAGGFTRLLRVVRHFSQKPVVRVHSPALGVVDCTHDHSLMLAAGCSAPPALIESPESLLRAEVRELPCGREADADWAFVYGVFFKAGSCGAWRRTEDCCTWRVACESEETLKAVQETIARDYETPRARGRVLEHRGARTRLCADFRELFYNAHGEKRVPALILNSGPAGQRHFLRGCGARAEVNATSKEAAAGLWIVARKLGYNVALRAQGSGWSLRMRLFAPRVPLGLSVTPRAYSAQYLYDVETEEHHFHAGPGEMVAHNTDSAFVQLPPSQRQLSPEALFAVGQEIAHLVTANYTQCLDPSLRDTCVVALEMEKYLRPLILYKKKRYVGIAFEDAQKEGKFLARGLELVRKDAAPLVRKCEADVLDALLKRESPLEAVACVERALQTIAELPAGGPFQAVAMSKSLHAHYVNPDGMAHVKVASLMNARDPGSAPRVGDRVEYVVVASSSPRVVDRVEDVAYAEAHALAPDWHFYVQALEKPLLRVLEVPLLSMDVSLYNSLINSFKEHSHEALKRCRKHGKVRHGSVWIQGHACKAGPPQLKLSNFFAPAPDRSSALESASALTPASASTAPPRPAAQAAPRAAEKSASAAAEARSGRNKRSVMDHLQNTKQPRARQTTL
jgi:DNA polymerase elongation subunit (family B)